MKGWSTRPFAAWQWLMLLGIGIATGSLSALAVLGSTYADVRNQLGVQAESPGKAVTVRLAAVEAILNSLTGLYQASENPDTAGLAAAAKALMADYPYISSVAYVSRISPADRKRFVGAMRQQGFPYFHLFSANDGKAVSGDTANMVVSYIEPLKPSSARYLGADLLTEPSVASALSRAVDHGSTTLAPAAIFGQASGSLLIKATYFGHWIADSVEQRRRQASGAFLLTMHGDRLLEDLGAKGSGLDAQLIGLPVESVEAQSESSLLSRGIGAMGVFPFAGSVTVQTHINLGSSPLLLRLTASASLTRAQIVQAAIIGLLTTLLTVLIPIAIANQRLANKRRLADKEALFKEREQAAVTLQAIGDAVITIDNEFRVQYMNPVAESLTGWNSGVAAGHRLDHILELTDEQTGTTLDYPERNYLRGLETDNGRLQLLRASGDTVAVHHTLSRILDVNGAVTGAVLVIRDVSRERQLTRELAFRASHDPLTHLPNRKLFQERLVQAIKEVGSERKLVGVLFFDLDRFKLVNDTLGHAAGDELLKKVAIALRTCVRDQDLLARLGGDEFAAILRDLPSPEVAEAAAKRALSTLNAPFDLFGSEVFLTTSIGMAMYPQDGEDLPSLLKSADAACYHAKARGRNNYQVFNISLNLAAEARLRLEHHLRQALARNEFRLDFQPQLDLKSGRVSGVEALLRWSNPELGEVGPDEFVRVAEETGLIVPIGRWVLETACQQASLWQQQGLEPIQISVNLSPRQFRESDLAQIIGSILMQASIQPATLRLEITESAIMENLEESLAILHQLSTMGIGLSIDDFGTGYSSLAALKQFPLDAVKIDCSFVRDLTRDPDSLEIVNAIIAMAHSIRLKVVAEGVENDEQLQLLWRGGCDEIQGYHVSRPLPADQMTMLLGSDFRRRPAASTEPLGKRIAVLRHFREA